MLFKSSAFAKLAENGCLIIKCSITVICLSIFSQAVEAGETAWLIDGFHGGVYGHYPPGYTGFVVEQLKENPEWRINLEIESETWDMVQAYEPEAYSEFKKLMENQSDAGRIEIVNPSFTQSYLFQASGESVIRQFDYGMRKIREHFPGAVFSTYSSELVDAGRPARTAAFDEAWQDVLLTQHHDCWIVPYNRPLGNTWIDQVRRWTTVANSISDLAMQTSVEALLNGERTGSEPLVRVFNPTAAVVDAVVPVSIPKTRASSMGVFLDAAGRRFATQVVPSETVGESTLLVRAIVPPMGYATLERREDVSAEGIPVTAVKTNGVVVMESDFYRIEFDPAHGGTIRSLVAKRLGNRELVDAESGRRFNELRGNFYEQGGFHSTADETATVAIRESGPLRATLEISGELAGSPFVQRVSISQGSPVIDCPVRIDWQGNPRIGEFQEKDGFKNRRRPAYDDRFKLLALFPVKMANQEIAKNAPFDVCESKLEDTFYHSWENIKNNVILNWVDVSDGSGDCGLALFSDHTTSYTHGPTFPLGLTIQYAGKGLWGRDYRTGGPTEVHYALMPHEGRWDTAGISSAAASWCEPVVGAVARGGQVAVRTLIDPGSSGWEVPAMFQRDGAIYVRLFNASGDDKPQELGIGFEPGHIELVELDGRIIERLKPKVGDGGKRTISLSMPRFGVRTLRFSTLRTSGK